MMKIQYGFQKTDFGNALIGVSGGAVCHFTFVSGRTEAISELRGRWPKAEYVEDSKAVERFVQTALNGSGDVMLPGTPFQRRVWSALRRVKRGETTTYGQLAKVIGRPTAARAVGAAVGANRIAVLVPCHRVLPKSGGLGGFRWGAERKRALLAWEAARG